MSTVIVNSAGQGSGQHGGQGQGGGGALGKLGKKSDWLVTGGLIVGAGIIAYLATKYFSGKLNGGGGDLSSLLSGGSSAVAPPAVDNTLAQPATSQYPTTLSQVPNLAGQPSLNPLTQVNSYNPYQLNPFLGTTSPNALYGDEGGSLPTVYPPPGFDYNRYLNQPAYSYGPRPLGFGQRIDYPGYFGGSTPALGFRAKKQGAYDHDHEHKSEHDSNKNYDQIGDDYLQDTEDEELAVEEPYLHEIYAVNEHTADEADFDQMAYAEDDDAVSHEEMDVHIRPYEVDDNDAHYPYAGHGHRHKHDKDDKENRHSEEKRDHVYHMDSHGMGNTFKSRIVRDHKGKMLGLAHPNYGQQQQQQDD